MTGADLFTVDEDGTTVSRFTTECGDDRVPEWSADGTRIAWNNVGVTKWGNVRSAILIAGADGSRPLDHGPGTSPAWSPDGSRLAIVGPALTVMSADAAERTVIYGDSIVYDAAWAPKGDEIVFSASPRGTEDVTPDLYTIKPDGSGLEQLTATETLSEGNVDWHPDGSRFVFERQGASGTEPLSDLFTMERASTVEARLTETVDVAETHPAWSPDGTKIAYAAIQRDQSVTGVFILDAGGGDTRPILGTEGARDADWQPLSSTAGPLAPAPPPPPTQCPRPGLDPPPSDPDDIVLNTSRRVVRWGAALIFTGRIVSDVPACRAGRDITIRGGSTTQPLVAVTDAAGRFSAAIRPTAKTTYDAYAPPISGHCEQALSSSSAVGVRVGVDLTRVPSDPHALSARVRSCDDHGGTEIVLQRRDQGRFTTVRRTRLDMRCTATVAGLKPGLYRARWAAQDRDHETGLSRRVRLGS